MSLFVALRNHLLLHSPRLRNAITKALVKDRDMTVPMFGANIRINSRKEIGYLRAAKFINSAILLRDEIPSISSLCLLLKPDDTFLDIGSNVGVFSATIAKMASVYNTFKIYAFEANPDTATRLRLTLAGTSAQIIEIALSDRDGELAFRSSQTSGGFGSGPDGAIKLKCARLDSLSIKGDSLVLKIDVEGHEREVLAGCSGIMPRCRIIMIDGYDDKAIPAHLRSLGFETFDARTLIPAEMPFSLMAVRPA